MATVDSDRSADQRFLELPKVEVAAADPEWVAKWSKYSQRTAKVVSELSVWSEPVIAREIGARIPSSTALFISSSRPIRDIEGFAAARSGVETFANRGLAGIDGNISTALGIASVRKECVAVIGDLGFLHDLTGLIQNEEINLRIFVIDNNGGGIFSTLNARGSKGFETVFGTPHNLDICAVTKAMGYESSKIENTSALIAQLSKPVKGVSICVVSAPSRESNAELIKSIYDKMASL